MSNTASVTELAPPEPSSRGWFWLFAGAHTVVWTVLPVLLYSNLPLDTVEGLAWGRQAELGYYNHPPAWPWLLGLTRWLAVDQDWAVYLLGQLTVVATLFFVWRLALRMVPPGEALRAVLLLEGVFYIGYNTLEYNSNLVVIAAWAAVAWQFHRSLRAERWWPWVGLGLAAGLGVYCKYTIMVLFGCLAGFLVWRPEGRRTLRTAGPYAAAATALLVAAPHLWWLIRSGYLPFRYALDRGQSLHGRGGTVLSSVTFLGAQLLDMAGLLVVVLIAARRRSDSVPAFRVSELDRALVRVLAVGPLAVCAVLGLVLQLNPPWGGPMLSFAGLLAVVSLPAGWRTVRFRWAWAGVCGTWVLVFLAIVTVRPYVTHRGFRTDFPGRELAVELQRAWRERVGRPLTLVHGETWLAGNVVAYAPDRPQALVVNDYVTDIPLLRINPWVTESKLACGAVLVWTPQRELPGESARLFPGAEEQPPLRLQWHSRARLSSVVIHWAIARPDGLRCRQVTRADRWWLAAPAPVDAPLAMAREARAT
jgi:hypothetical protein